MNDEKTKILSDTTDPQPLIGIESIANIFVNVVKSNSFNDSSLNIGIFGPWGIGKSSLMKTIEKKLTPDSINGYDIKINTTDKIITLLFNSWEFQEEPVIWTPLAYIIIKNIQKMVENNVDQIYFKKEDEDSLRELLGIAKERITQKIFRYALSSLNYLSPELGNVLFPKKDNNILLEDNFAEIVSQTSQIRNSYKAVIEKTKYKLVVFIDDIDRINDPGKALNVLEGLHLFLNVTSSFYFLAISVDVLRQGLSKRYSLDKKEGKELSKTYIEKMIQIPFTLPSYKQNQIQLLIKSYFDEEIINNYLKYLTFNPRWLKRLANQFNLTKQLAKSENIVDEDSIELILKMIILQNKWDSFVNKINRELSKSEFNLFWKTEEDEDKEEYYEVLLFLRESPALISKENEKNNINEAPLFKYINLTKVNLPETSTKSNLEKADTLFNTEINIEHEELIIIRKIEEILGENGKKWKFYKSISNCSILDNIIKNYQEKKMLKLKDCSRLISEENQLSKIEGIEVYISEIDQDSERKFNQIYSNLFNIFSEFKNLKLIRLIGRFQRKYARLISYNINEMIIEDLIQKVPNIEILDLISLGISSLPENMGLLKSLIHLNVNNNLLESLPESLLGIETLQELDIGFNNFKTFSYQKKNFINLKSINCSNNVISEFNFDSMKAEILDASFNAFNSFPKDIYNLTSLIFLNLEHNNIEIIEYFINLLKEIKILNLSNDNLRTLPNNIQLNKLRILRIISEKLIEIPPLKDLDNLKLSIFSKANIRNLQENISKTCKIEEEIYR